MKKFIFKVETHSINRTYGGSNQTATVYQVKNNNLIYLGITRKWNTSSYMGAVGEVHKWLLANNYITKKARDIQQADYETKNDYYHYNYGSKALNKYKIDEI